MPVVTSAFTVRAPLAAVAEFHREARTLQRLSPPPLFIQLHRADPPAEGSAVEFTLWIGPLPVRWVAVYSNVSAMHGFTDTQQRGPLRRWRHTHRFEAIDPNTTRVSDQIEYEYPRGLAGILTRLLFSSVGLRIVFLYRAWMTRRSLERQE